MVIEIQLMCICSHINMKTCMGTRILASALLWHLIYACIGVANCVAIRFISSIIDFISRLHINLRLGFKFKSKPNF